mmetsp:Transcript_4546/g.6797  ORF Transcript_4546/g.6797 Transcript_4546/m.6797 type:complete len:264 (-) Transcript_4546:1618-2409(-)
MTPVYFWNIVSRDASHTRSRTVVSISNPFMNERVLRSTLHIHPAVITFSSVSPFSQKLSISFIMKDTSFSFLSRLEPSDESLIIEHSRRGNKRMSEYSLSSLTFRFVWVFFFSLFFFSSDKHSLTTFFILNTFFSSEELNVRTLHSSGINLGDFKRFWGSSGEFLENSKHERASDCTSSLHKCMDFFRNLLRTSPPKYGELESDEGERLKTTGSIRIALSLAIGELYGCEKHVCRTFAMVSLACCSILESLDNILNIVDTCHA